MILETASDAENRRATAPKLLTPVIAAQELACAVAILLASKETPVMIMSESASSAEGGYDLPSRPADFAECE